MLCGYCNKTSRRIAGKRWILHTTNAYEYKQSVVYIMKIKNMSAQLNHTFWNLYFLHWSRVRASLIESPDGRNLTLQPLLLCNVLTNQVAKLDLRNSCWHVLSLSSSKTTKAQAVTDRLNISFYTLLLGLHDVTAHKIKKDFENSVRAGEVCYGMNIAV